MKRTEEMENKRMLTGKAVLFHASRIFLGGVFIYASFDKIFNPDLFAEAVFKYQILPEVLINLTALVLPLLELVLGVLLLAGIWLPGAVFLSTLLLLIFSGVLIFNIGRGLDIGCGCFSTEPLRDPISFWTVLRDASFLIPACYLLFVNQTE